jgi:aminopeptidase
MMGWQRVYPWLPAFLIIGNVWYLECMETGTIERERATLLQTATKNIGDILTIAIEHDASKRALVIYDTENELTTILTDAYRALLPEARFVDFHTRTKEEIIALFDELAPRDLVVLIQTGDFRLNEFRIRIQLFQRKLKVIDHQHLYRNTPDSWGTYINALAYDTAWYRGTGHRLKDLLANTEKLRVVGEGTELIVEGGLEVPKPNLGDYAGMENIGGTFPIGEVFTEARDLSRVNGSLRIDAFADTTFNIRMHTPFRIYIEDGIVVSWDDSAPTAFTDVIAQVKTNERTLIREIGFGLNRAITREHPLRDITAFERILGLHFSLGEKHTVYKKQGITADKTRFHVDLFPLVNEVYADGTCIFRDGVYLV